MSNPETMLNGARQDAANEIALDMFNVLKRGAKRHGMNDPQCRGILCTAICGLILHLEAHAFPGFSRNVQVILENARSK
jgi:hypothetical protein